MANLNDLVKTLKQSVNTDIPLAQIPKLLSLADSVDTKNIRSYVFSPSFYATESTDARPRLHHPAQRRPDPQGGQGGVLDAAGPARAPRAAGRRGRARLGAERVRDVRGCRRTRRTSSPTTGSTRPRRTSSPSTASTTKIVVYNGAETEMPETIKYLEDLFNVKVTTATDPKTTVDIDDHAGSQRPEPLDRPRRLTRPRSDLSDRDRQVASRPQSDREPRAATGWPRHPRSPDRRGTSRSRRRPAASSS